MIRWCPEASTPDPPRRVTVGPSVQTFGGLYSLEKLGEVTSREKTWCASRNLLCDSDGHYCAELVVDPPNNEGAKSHRPGYTVANPSHGSRCRVNTNELGRGAPIWVGLWEEIAPAYILLWIMVPLKTDACLSFVTPFCRFVLGRRKCSCVSEINVGTLVIEERRFNALADKMNRAVALEDHILVTSRSFVQAEI